MRPERTFLGGRPPGPAILTSPFGGGREGDLEADDLAALGKRLDTVTENLVFSRAPRFRDQDPLRKRAAWRNAVVRGHSADRHGCRRTSLSMLVATVGSVVACSAPAPGEKPENLASYSAQMSLLAGIPAAEPKVRVLRQFNSIKLAPEGRLPEGDMSGTPEAARGYAELAKIADARAISDWPDEAPAGLERVIFFNADERTEYELEFEAAELTRVLEELTARGGTTPSADPLISRTDAMAPAGPELRPQGWSGGVDSRIKKNISTSYPYNHSVLRRIGELNNGGCSGVLVGRRLVLTAAHCVITSDLVNYIHAFRARRSGSTAPYGTESSVGLFYLTGWLDNECWVTRLTQPWPCDAYDFAVLLLRQNAWDQCGGDSPGFMGYASLPPAYLRGAVNHNDGYPRCPSETGVVEEEPAGCSHPNHDIYGQVAAGNADFFQYPEGSTYSYFRSNLDLSAGHSGSPDWVDNYGPIAVGISIREDCFGACTGHPSQAYPNGFRTLTPFLTGLISTWRAQYP